MNLPRWNTGAVGVLLSGAMAAMRVGGRYFLYFTAGRGPAHQMYGISSAAPHGGYTAETQLALPDGNWAIGGTLSTINGQRLVRVGPAARRPAHTTSSRNPGRAGSG